MARLKVLTAAQASLIQGASDQAIMAGLARMTTAPTTGIWIPATNAYAADVVSAIEAQLPNNSFAMPDLADYVAASLPLHCVDGWAFLGRALDSHIRGDQYAAVHLAYYAELRAAMAILASEGIGVFITNHMTFDNTGTPQLLKGPTTHDFAWLALIEWAGRTGTGQPTTDIVNDGRLTLTDWIQDFSKGYVQGSVARDWLETWSLDLQNNTGDRTSRNIASYRPTRLIGRPTSTCVQASELLRKFWEPLQPSAANGFDQFDRYLIRLALESRFYVTTGNRAVDDPTGFQQRVTQTVASLGYTGNEAQRWINTITRQGGDAQDPMVFVEADKKDPVGTTNQHVQVIARATLLLRLATGIAAAKMRHAGFSQTDLSNWGKQEAIEFGFALPTTQLGQLADLWADVQVGLDDLSGWEAANPQATSSRRQWYEDFDVARALLTLGGSERIALWAFG